MAKFYQRQSLKKQSSGMSTAFVSGNFNVLHVGHQRLFEAARKLADRLIVGVCADKIAGSAAYVHESDRISGVRNNVLVDEVVLIKDSVFEEIVRLKPAVVIKGREHEGAINVEEEAVQRYGGRLLFTSGAPYSPLVSHIKGYADTKVPRFNLNELGFIERRDLSVNKIEERLSAFSSLKVGVIGDVIVDEYTECIALGMSHEDHNVVLSPNSSQHFIGGAGIVARHANSLGADVTLLSVVGDDDAGKMVETILSEERVNTALVRDVLRPTTLKQRFNVENITRFRLSHLEQSTINNTLEQELIDCFNEISDNLDLVVFSDFSYGCITQNMINHITRVMREKGSVLAADSQSSSQLGDITRFHKMDLITPTEREARLSLRNFDDGLVEIAEKIRNQIEAKNVLISLGSDGLLVHTKDHGNERVVTDRLPAFNRFPVDISGAGDALLVAGSMAIAAGASIWEAGVVGSIAAGIQVSRPGNQPISLDEMRKEIVS